MKKTFLICFLLFSISAFANRIDSLQTDSDVYKFLVSIDSGFRGVNVNAYKTLYWDTLERRTADSLHVKMWQKADFNNDGQTDLLAYAYAGGSIYLLAVISDNNKYNIYDLNFDNFAATFIPIVKKEGTKSILFLYYYEEKMDNIYKPDTFPPRTRERRLVCKKLVYKYNYFFLELNDNPPQYNIQNISYATEGCMGSCPIFNLSINSNRQAIYESKHYSGEPGTYNSLIDTSSYNQIVAILNYINLPKLSDKYQVDWTDDASCQLTITYDNGKKKKISDYGKQGTYGLYALYRKLSELRKTQKWKKAN